MEMPQPKMLLPDSALKERSRITMEMIEAVRAGLPYNRLESLGRSLGLSRNEMARMLRIQPRTLDRRKEEGRLKPAESDRLYRVARIYTHASEVLESEEKARSWLQAPNRSLGGRIPWELLDTEVGAREVEETLERIEHGVFA